MNGPANPDPPPEFSDSDLQWYAALTGQSTGDADTAAAQEGRGLRAALEVRRQELLAGGGAAPTAAAGSSQSRLLQLKAQMREQGLFEPRGTGAENGTDQTAAQAAAPPPAVSNVIEFPWWRRRPALVALAASLVMAVVLVQQQLGQPDFPDAPVMQGAGGVQAVNAARPRQAAQALADGLRQAGLRPGIYQRGKTYIVDFNVMAAELPVTDPALSPLKLKAAPGFNRIEISPAP